MSDTVTNNDSSPGEGLTFEKVWAMFQETGKRMEETDRLIRETGEQIKETNRRIGELGNRFGELAEHLVAPSIMEKFNDRGFSFTKLSQDCKIVEPGEPKAVTEVDILLENGDIVIAVEVKAKPKQADVDDHILRLEKLRLAADRRNDSRRYQGALAGAIMGSAVRDYALQMGLYVIEQTGDTVQINTPEGFTAREW